MRDRPFRKWSAWQNIVFETAAYSALAIFCYLAFRIGFGAEANEDYALTALLVCFVSCVAPIFWMLGNRQGAYSDLSLLFIMGSRFSLLLVALTVSAATKWQHNNSFCNCLLGYYFPFLILQSALLIRNQSFPHPPQS